MVQFNLGQSVAKAKASESSVYWLDGRYLVYIDVVKITNRWDGKVCFIVQGYNLESTNAERPVGSQASTVIMLDNVMGPGNVKAFLAKAVGCIPDDLDEDTINLCVSDDNPLHGKVLDLECVTILTKVEKKPYTKLMWGKLHDMSVEEADALLAGAREMCAPVADDSDK